MATPLPAAAASGKPTTTIITTDDQNPPNIYEQALNKLHPLQPVLWGLNHRNRNQHRRAAWWGTFGMLRRRVDKLVEELVGAAARFQSRCTRKKAKKRKRAVIAVADVEEKDEEEEKEVRDHVRWLRHVLVPKCYLSFSQLTADNQFATLGVVLLGALAQVHAACVQLVGDAAEDSSAHGVGADINTASSIEGQLGKSNDIKPPLPSLTRPTLASNSIMSDQVGDRGGAVISRDQVARAEKLRRKKEKLEEDKSDMPTSKGKDQRDVAPKVKADDDTKNISGKDELKPPKKKKKAKKGGDEFDDLFKGLF